MATPAINPGQGDGGLPPGTPPPAPVTQPQAAPPDQGVQRMQAELGRQKALLDALRATVMAPPPANPQTQEAQQKEMIKQFQADPVGMTAAIANRAAAEAIARNGASSFDTQVEMAKQIARGQDPVGQARWDKYYGEIEAKMAQVDPQFRTNATLWTSSFRMVVGEHANDLIEEARKSAAEGGGAPAIRVSNGDGPGAPSKAAPSTTKAEKLTPEEERVARKFHLTNEQYLQGKKDNLGQSDQIMSPTGPSSWDQYVTFSTRDKRVAERQAKREAARAKK